MTMLATDIEKNKSAKGSIAFLYAKPPGMVLEEGGAGEGAGEGGLEDGADEAARAFFKQNEEAAKAKKVREHKESAAFSMHGKLSALEQMTGTRRRKEVRLALPSFPPSLIFVSLFPPPSFPPPFFLP
jgi:hypothetical protein